MDYRTANSAATVAKALNNAGHFNGLNLGDLLTLPQRIAVKQDHEIQRQRQGLTADVLLALALHLVMLPWWGVVGGLLGGSIEESGDAPGLGYALLGAVGVLWVWLLTKLLRWWKEGRRPLWSYPLRWALVTGFVWALVIPPVRRAMRPKAVPQSRDLTPGAAQ